MTAPKRRAPAPRKPRRSRSRLGVDERRAQLVSLGLAIFATRPYDEVAVEDLARAAGISKGLLYHYFPTKRDLYVAALGNAAQRLLDETLLPTVDQPPAERLRRGLETYIDFVERHGPAFVALLRGGIGSDSAVAAILERTRDTFVERILENVPAELATPLVRLALRGWVGFVEAVATDWVTRRDVTRPELLGLLEATLLGAVQSLTGQSLV